MGGLGTHDARPGLLVEAREDQADVKDAKGMENRPVATPPRPPWDYADELGLTGPFSALFTGKIFFYC